MIDAAFWATCARKAYAAISLALLPPEGAGQAIVRTICCLDVASSRRR
jgi:hypothetical protein